MLADKRRFRVVYEARTKSTDPAPLKVKDVYVEDRRYVVCVNPEEVQSDRLKRETIVAALREQLRKGDKSLVGNQGYRQYLKVEGQGHFVVDEAKLQEEARYDGVWVLRTNTELTATEVALHHPIQEALAGRALVPQLQDPDGHAADLSSLRRHHPRACVLFVLSFAVAPRITSAAGGARSPLRVGRCDARLGARAIRGGRASRQAVSVAE